MIRRRVDAVCRALIITLCFSRYQFEWPTFRQTTESICEGLDQAWWFFGDITAMMVPDNMNGIGMKPDAFKPTLNPAFLDYAQARGVFVDPTWIGEPKDKPQVENNVSEFLLYVPLAYAFDHRTSSALDSVLTII